MAKRGETELIGERRPISFSSAIRSGCQHCCSSPPAALWEFGLVGVLASLGAFWLLSCSALRATAMTLLMTLSWRFLLILVSERARRLSWGVGRNSVTLLSWSLLYVEYTKDMDDHWDIPWSWQRTCQSRSYPGG